jgi:ADP-ribose pyrophosphatase YjhB (NUDIX family)
MDFSPVTTLREEHCANDEEQDNGFNTKEFALMSREDKVSPTAIGTPFSCNRYGVAPPIPYSSNCSARPHSMREAGSPIEYRHPRMVVRCIAQHKGRVLLCQRADEPRRGFWNTPGGFLESGETLRTAVIRETLEECGVTVDAPKLGFIYEFPQLNEIVVTFLAEVQDPSIAPGKESLDARLFEIKSIPWMQLAFPTDSDALRRTFEQSPYLQRCLQIVECFWESDGRIVARQR